MAKLLCTYRGLKCIPLVTRYRLCISRNIALPNIPRSMPHKNSEYDALRPLRRDVTGPPDPDSVLAGGPHRSSALRQEIREEVLSKWNQRPSPDFQKEWMKYAIYY